MRKEEKHPCERFNKTNGNGRDSVLSAETLGKFEVIEAKVKPQKKN